MDHPSNVVAPIPPSENKRFYPALNGLRAVAILLVFFEHYVNHDNAHPALEWGWVGVDVFFVLSGFLITGILYDTRDTANRFRNFYARRALRIFPLYYAVILFAVLTYPLAHWVLHPGWILLPFYLHNFARYIWMSDYYRSPVIMDHLFGTTPVYARYTLLMGHFWSLCVEEQFYLVWPFVVLFVKDRVRLRNICCAGILLVLAARIAGLFLIPPAYLQTAIYYRATPFRVDALLIGGLLALMQRGPEFRWLQRILEPCFYTCLAGGVLLMAAYVLHTGHFYHPTITARLLSTVGFTLVDTFCGFTILMALKPRGWMFRLLTLAPLMALGEISYGFYVFHDLFRLDIMELLRSYGHVTEAYIYAATSVTGFLLTLLLAFLSFRFFEAPILRFKTRFAS